MIHSPTNKERDWFATCLANAKLMQKLKSCKLLVCDVDGTLTNAHIFLPNEHDELKGFSVQDGFGINQAIKAGLQIGFLSGRNSDMVSLRAKRLGVPKELCLLGIDTNKIATLERMQSFAKATKEETIYIGDDILDIEARDACALFVAPNNAPFYIQNAADLTIPLDGGYGAVRILLDLVLYGQKRHFAQNLIKKSLSRV